MNCFYRNCINSFNSKKKNQKYCCSKCKNNERKYIQREIKKFKEDKLNTAHILKQYETAQAGDKNILELYKNIYSK